MWPDNGKPCEPQIGANSTAGGFATTRTDSAQFSIKTRLAELRFTRGLSYVSDGPAYAFCFGLHLRSVVHLAAITHRKNRVGSPRIHPFWITRLQNAQTIRK
jgi:hypothetical protein